jgi:deoxyribonuclease V
MGSTISSETKYLSMALGFDFYAALRGLLEQIQEDKATTPRHLACALGDPAADRAVIEALGSKEFQPYEKRVATEPHPHEKIFTRFDSDKPLIKLADEQRMMVEKVILDDQTEGVQRVAGVDAAYSNNKAYAACVVMDMEFNITELRTAVSEIAFPYIPGYLALREAPITLSAVREAPGFDVLLVNGHGVAHPRGCGLATYVGLELDAPTIGIARRRLVGDIRAERDGWAPIALEGVVVGAELRGKGRSPVYVSVGHRISLETSIEIVRDFQIDGGLPEPLRMAHSIAEEMRNSARR